MNASLTTLAAAITPEAIQAERRRRKRNRLATLFPAEGPFRRELYAKHLEFFKAGALHRERAFIAGNRVGKSEAGAYETALHLTGRYPDWWEGKRFDKAIKAWVAGDTSKTVREILQEKLLGPWGNFGTGMIPYDDIVDWSRKSGVADAVDMAYVRHVCGGTSVLVFKSYDQGRVSFQGSAIEFFWGDEEMSMEIYVEALMRTATTGGLCALTFTPLTGWSDVVDLFLGEKED